MSNNTLIETLGRTIDCTKKGVDPFSPQSILAANNVTQVIKWGDITTWSYQDGFRDFAKPENVAATYIGASAGADIFAQSDQDIVREIETDVKISAKYMGVSAKAGASFAYKDVFHQDKQYAFLTNSSDLFTAALIGNMNQIWAYVKSDLKAAMKALPHTYTDNDKIFHDFVSLWGTHLVSNVTYGTRFELVISCSKSNSEVNKNFKANVQAEYSGVVGGAEASVDVKDSTEYKAYQNDRTVTHTILGGNPQAAGVLNADPTNKEAAKSWAGSDRGIGFEALVHMDTFPLGDLLMYSTDKSEQAIGRALNDYIRYKVLEHEIQRVPRSSSPQRFGPSLTVFGPPTGTGSVTLKLRNDPVARFVGVLNAPLLGITISDDERTLKVEFRSPPSRPGARWAATVYFGIECGMHGTDLEFNGEGYGAWSYFTMNRTREGHINHSSPYDYYHWYTVASNGAREVVTKANLCSKGRVTSLYSTTVNSKTAFKGPHTVTVAEIEVPEMDGTD